MATTQLGEGAREPGGLVVRVQAAGVRQHPEQRPGELVRLPAERRPRASEGDAVGADADDGDGARPVAADLALEPRPAGADFVGGELVRGRGRAGDEVGDADAAGEQLGTLARMQLDRREAGGGERRPEAVAGAGEVPARRRRVEARVDAAEEDVEIRSDDVTQRAARQEPAVSPGSVSREDTHVSTEQSHRPGRQRSDAARRHRSLSRPLHRRLRLDDRRRRADRRQGRAPRVHGARAAATRPTSPWTRSSPRATWSSPRAR